jgi:hypothetical protein
VAGKVCNTAHLHALEDLLRARLVKNDGGNAVMSGLDDFIFLFYHAGKFLWRILLGTPGVVGIVVISSKPCAARDSSVLLES